MNFFSGIWQPAESKGWWENKFVPILKKIKIKQFPAETKWCAWAAYQIETSPAPFGLQLHPKQLCSLGAMLLLGFNYRTEWRLSWIQHTHLFRYSNLKKSSLGDFFVSFACFLPLTMGHWLWWQDTLSYTLTHFSSLTFLHCINGAQCSLRARSSLWVHSIIEGTQKRRLILKGWKQS